MCRTNSKIFLIILFVFCLVTCDGKVQSATIAVGSQGEVTSLMFYTHDENGIVGSLVFESAHGGEGVESLSRLDPHEEYLIVNFPGSPVHYRENVVLEIIDGKLVYEISKKKVV